jgi:nitroreductase
MNQDPNKAVKSVVEDTPLALASVLEQLIESRQNVAPKRLIAPGPSPVQLQQLFAVAAKAPDHGLLRPWRFILIAQEKRHDLGNAFVQALVQRDRDATAEQIDSAYTKAFRAPCVIFCVLCNKHSQPHIPKSERLVSLGCAVQNMLLMAQAMGIGSGITSGQAVDSTP